MADKPGLKAALAEAQPHVQSVPGAGAPPQQLALLPLRQVVADEENAVSDPPARGAGRPLGSKNKLTKAWAEFLLTRYSSPLVGLAEVYSRPITELAKDLGLKAAPTYDQALELLKLQLQCMKELAPYVHQKQPMAIEGDKGGLINLILHSGGATAQQVAEAGVMSVNFVDGEVLQNQQVTEPQTGNSVVSNSVASSQDTEQQQQNNNRPTD